MARMGVSAAITEGRMKSAVGRMHELLFVTLACVGLMAARVGYAAPAIELYGKLPQVELMRLSPSGQRVAMIGVVGDKRQLLVVALDGNRTLKAIAVGDTKVRNVWWAGDDHVLVMISATAELRPDFVSRAELYGVIHVGLNDAQPWVVFQKSDNIEHTVLGYSGAANLNGHWYGYFSGITRERTRGFSDTGYVRERTIPDLYRVDLDSGKPELVAHGSQYDEDWIVTPGGDVLAHSEYTPSTEDWTLHPAKDGKAVVTVHSATAQVGMVGPGRIAGTVAYADLTGDVDRIQEFNFADGKSEDLLGDHHVRGYHFDPVTGLMLGAATKEEPGELLFDASAQHRFDITRRAFPQQRVHLTSFTPQLDRMIVETQGTRDSGTYWFVNTATHHADPIGYSYAAIKPDDVGSVQAISYQAADGLALEGILTLPAGRTTKGLPLVVLPHGGPIDVEDTIGFDWWAQGLASLGYAVFQPNYRGSSGYGTAFRQAGYGEWGRKMLTDISDGISELAKQQIIDPKRVCIVGGSYGGYAALAGVTLQQGIYRCAVSVSGPSNLVSFDLWLVENWGLKSPGYREWLKLAAVDVGSPQTLDPISPAHFAARASGPVLLIHGKDDTRVPITQSQQMASALKSAGKTVEYVELDKEDHFLSHEATRTAMLKATAEFLQKYNPASGTD
jgi:dipeptidyl aminopeptidase/acylaminoacyl peptidase